MQPTDNNFPLIWNGIVVTPKVHRFCRMTCAYYIQIHPEITDQQHLIRESNEFAKILFNLIRDNTNKCELIGSYHQVTNNNPR